MIRMHDKPDQQEGSHTLSPDGICPGPYEHRAVEALRMMRVGTLATKLTASSSQQRPSVLQVRRAADRLTNEISSSLNGERSESCKHLVKLSSLL